MARLPRVLAVLIAALVLAVGAPASAAPTDTQIAKIYQLPCAEDVCGSGDKVIAAGALVRGRIQIHVSSRAALGMESLRLEAQGEDGFTCWKTWSFDGQTSTRQTYNWDTAAWPAACGGDDARPGTNGEVTLRAVATERASGESQTSPRVKVRVNNRPTTPEWASEPRAVGKDEGGPHVALRWYSNPEPDIVEYHYVRLDPNGEEAEFAVSADNPGAQGCDLADGVYSCTDDAFGAKGYGGRYSYSLIAYRASPSEADSCSIQSRGCLQSPLGAERSATLVEPGVEQPDTKVLSTGPGSGGSSTKVRPSRKRNSNRVDYSSMDEWKYLYEEGYEKTLPYDQRRLLQPPSDDLPPVFAAGPVAARTPASRDVWVFLAAGLIALVVAGHVARVARDPIS